MSYDSIELGHRLITLMAAAMLVVQMLLAGQRLLPTVIALFSLQSFFLACLAAAVAYVNHAHHVYIAAGLTLLLKVIVMPLLLAAHHPADRHPSGSGKLPEHPGVHPDLWRADARGIYGGPPVQPASRARSRFAGRGYRPVSHWVLSDDEPPEGDLSSGGAADRREWALPGRNRADLWNATDRGSRDLLRCAGGRDDSGHSVLSHRRNLRVDGYQ